jgi:hypothetical protein
MSMRVQNGEQVGPLAFGPITLFSVRADPARIRFVNAPGGLANPNPDPSKPSYLADLTAIRNLYYLVELTGNEDLLYLGQNSGIAVIYDAKHHKIIRLSMTSYILDVVTPEGHR